MPEHVVLAEDIKLLLFFTDLPVIIGQSPPTWSVVMEVMKE